MFPPGKPKGGGGGQKNLKIVAPPLRLTSVIVTLVLNDSFFTLIFAVLLFLLSLFFQVKIDIIQ